MDDARRARTALLAFLGLCFGLTCAAILGLRANGSPPSATGGAATAFNLGSLLLPALSAWVVRRLVTREGMADAGLRRGPLRAYVAIWLLVPCFVATALLLSMVLGLYPFDVAHVPNVPRAELLQMTARAVIFAATLQPLLTLPLAFGEQFGWTGLVLPKLLVLGWSPQRAAIVLGAIWGVWHCLALWPGTELVGAVLASATTVGRCMGFALVLTAIRLRTGSVFATSFAHGYVTNFTSATTIAFAGMDRMVAGPSGVIGIVLSAGIGWYLLRGVDPSLAVARPSSAPPSGMPSPTADIEFAER